ncbi:unnamed protein product [Sphenostylis stenocarpa]|uniref:Uncharacterized protein n=1 Tax=Sphenostylis stenocarpa TaxID=92480 RepID=A0AA86SNL6_9FABA|nr:unnamed protein product [Sphenostylis stenocarpa]
MDRENQERDAMSESKKNMDGSRDEKEKQNNWTWSQNKAFEEALATVPENDNMRWQKIAAQVPGKSPADIMEHYQKLLQDVADIQSGRVGLPDTVQIMTRAPTSAFIRFCGHQHDSDFLENDVVPNTPCAFFPSFSWVSVSPMKHDVDFVSHNTNFNIRREKYK